ncbi:MAG: hypothetical protein ACJAS9_003000 [Polaribacter sp.]|jgi:hypothetical protein
MLLRIHAQRLGLSIACFKNLDFILSKFYCDVASSGPKKLTQPTLLDLIVMRL